MLAPSVPTSSLLAAVDSGAPPAGGASSATPPPIPAAAQTGEEWRGMSGEQFRARLEHERGAGARALLRELGFDSPEAAKSFAASARERAEAEKSELQRAQERLSTLEAQAKRAADLDEIVARHAEQEWRSLPEAMQRFVQAQAGDDAAARLRTIAAAREAGLMTAAHLEAQQQRTPRPATTVAPSGPSSPRSTGTGSAYERWQGLKGRSALAAAQFYQQNSAAIEKSRPQSE